MIDDRPLTPDEMTELEEFLKVHHPPFYEEHMRMVKADMVERLPILHRMLFEEMRRYQRGEATRDVTFL